MIADNTRRQLDPRYIPLERVVGYITTVCLSLVGLAVVGLFAAYSSLGMVTLAVAFAAWAIATVVLAYLARRWPEFAFRHAAYTIADDEIEIAGGVVWRHVFKVPRSRVQHTDVAQGPLERRYGLATLVIHTAGTQHARVTLEGLAHETALRIRDHLLPREEADAV